MSDPAKFKPCPWCGHELRLHHRMGLVEKGEEFNATLVCKNPKCEFETNKIREMFDYGAEYLGELQDPDNEPDDPAPIGDSDVPEWIRYPTRVR
jgi:hypothetical protein